MDANEEITTDWAQDENGVDLDLLRYKMSLTVEERIEQHRRALENVLLVRDAGLHAGYRQTGGSASED